MNETIAYQLTHHANDPIAEKLGSGWFYTFDKTNEPELIGPFDTRELADEAAVKAVELTLADMVSEALGLAA